MKKILMLGAAILTMQALPALAQEKPHEGKKERGNKMFEMQDANKDGVISEAEFTDFSKKRFAETDANKDGKVTKDEAKAHHDAMKAKWKEMKKSKDGPKDAPKDAPKE